jgi:hypothetical protein
VKLTVPSGLTIRVLGEFVNKGTIEVLTAAEGGSIATTASGSLPDVIAPLAGVSLRAAQAGEIGFGGLGQVGGGGGLGLTELEARQVLTAPVTAGGGGAAGAFILDELEEFSVIRNLGSRGGGAIRILSQGGITIAPGGAIKAEGQTLLGGGGGGGIVILASQTSVDVAGAISAVGGDGFDSTAFSAPDGGGGGGIVHLLAPSVINGGEVDVSGGVGGKVIIPVGPFDDGEGGGIPSLGGGLEVLSAGGGGGACGGSGGAGSSIPALIVEVPDFPPPTERGLEGGGGIEVEDALDGQNGFNLVTIVDPTSLL